VTGPAGDRDLAELDAALRELAAETAQPAPPAGLGRRVMERVDALAAHDRWAVLPGPGGATAVAVGVVAVLARRAVRAVPGAADAAVVVRPVDDGPAVLLEVALTAHPGVPLPDLARRVRAALVAAVAAQTGLTAARVDVHVQDIAV